jgi:hypothetical protein
MKKTLLAMVLLGSSAMFGQGFSIGVGVNVGVPGGYYVAPPPPPPPVYAVPPSPGYGYAWVPGFYVRAGNHYRWTTGYWTRPPRRAAVWVAPRYQRNRYHPGYWR